MEALDKALRNVKAIDNLDKCGLLDLELRAIEFWDANYHMELNRDDNDILAFKARQMRKKEILQERAKSGRH